MIPSPPGPGLSGRVVFLLGRAEQELCAGAELALGNSPTPPEASAPRLCVCSVLEVPLHPGTASSFLMDNRFRLLLHLGRVGNGLWKQRTPPALSLCPTELSLLGGPRNVPPSDTSHHPWPLIPLRSSAISVCFPYLFSDVRKNSFASRRIPHSTTEESMNVITWGDIVIVRKQEFWRRILSVSAETKCRGCHLSWCILQLWRAVDDQAYRDSPGVFQCGESCVPAKPSQALQRHFCILCCQSQALCQFLFGVICA